MIVLPGIITPKRKESVDTLSEEIFVSTDISVTDSLSEEWFRSYDTVLTDSLVEEIFYE